MGKWRPKDPTLFDILVSEDDNRIEKARNLWRQGIDKKDERQYVLQSLMAIKTERAGIVLDGEEVLVTNGRSFAKLKDKFARELATANNEVKEWFSAIRERLNGNNVTLAKSDGERIRDIMGKPWGWHIVFVFEQLGYLLQTEKMQSPFDREEMLEIASPRENAELHGRDFFTADRGGYETIGGIKFSQLSLWLALKLVEAETAQTRGMSLYTHKFEDGDTQSYLRVTTPTSDCIICN